MAQLEFECDLDCYQEIGSLLADAVREEWLDIIVEVELDGIEVEIIMTYLPVGGTKRKDVPVIPTLGECFYLLARLVSTAEKGLYKTCAFSLRRDGTYDAQFVY